MLSRLAPVDAASRVPDRGAVAPKAGEAGYALMQLPKHITAAGEAIVEMDDRAHQALRPHRGSTIAGALDLLGKIGDQPQLRTISAALLAAGTFAGSDRLVRAGARMMIAHEAATLSKDQVKNRIDRVRPRTAKDPSDKKPRKGEHRSKEMTSFPSGHSAGAMAVTRAFSREFPEYAAPALALGTIVAGVQVPRRAHYPTDILAGMLLGIAAEAVVHAAWSAAGMNERSSSER